MLERCWRSWRLPAGASLQCSLRHLPRLRLWLHTQSAEACVLTEDWALQLAFAHCLLTPADQAALRQAVITHNTSLCPAFYREAYLKVSALHVCVCARGQGRCTAQAAGALTGSHLLSAPPRRRRSAAALLWHRSPTFRTPSSGLCLTPAKCPTSCSWHSLLECPFHRPLLLQDSKSSPAEPGIAWGDHHMMWRSAAKGKESQEVSSEGLVRASHTSAWTNEEGRPAVRAGPRAKSCPTCRSASRGKRWHMA